MIPNEDWQSLINAGWSVGQFWYGFHKGKYYLLGPADENFNKAYNAAPSRRITGAGTYLFGVGPFDSYDEIVLHLVNQKMGAEYYPFSVTIYGIEIVPDREVMVSR